MRIIDTHKKSIWKFICESFGKHKKSISKFRCESLVHTKIHLKIYMWNHRCLPTIYRLFRYKDAYLNSFFLLSRGAHGLGREPDVGSLKIFNPTQTKVQPNPFGLVGLIRLCFKQSKNNVENIKLRKCFIWNTIIHSTEYTSSSNIKALHLIF